MAPDLDPQPEMCPLSATIRSTPREESKTLRFYQTQFQQHRLYLDSRNCKEMSLIKYPHHNQNYKHNIFAHVQGDQ